MIQKYRLLIGRHTLHGVHRQDPEKVIPVEDILFASETIGARQGIDPETGHYEDVPP